jgi:hypothetical protein
MRMEEVIHLGRSWAFAPELSIQGNEFISHGFDMSERSYQIENTNTKATTLAMSLAASAEKPVCNPAFVITNWPAAAAKVLVDSTPAQDARIGIQHKLEGDNLIVFLFLQKSEPVDIKILSE